MYQLLLILHIAGGYGRVIAHQRRWADWLWASAMLSGAVIISVRALPLARAGDSKSSGLLAFSALGATLPLIDLSAFRAHRYQGQRRIAAHASRMLAGFGAALAAFGVTALKIRTRPSFLAFLLPARLVAPLTWYWQARIRSRIAKDTAVGV
jgi:hypothetical protein